MEAQRIMSDKRHNELVSAYLEGTLDEKSTEHLFQCCEQDPKLLDELASSLEVERMIEFIGIYDEDTETFKGEVLHRITQNDTVNIDFTPSVIERIESQDKWRKRNSRNMPNLAVEAGSRAIEPEGRSEEARVRPSRRPRTAPGRGRARHSTARRSPAGTSWSSR